MMHINEWVENKGTVPEGIGPDTVIEVEYRDGIVKEHKGKRHICIWAICGPFDDCDIIRWRFV